MSHAMKAVWFYLVQPLELNLIGCHSILDFIPSCTSLISSNADHPRKNKSLKNKEVSKPSQNLCSSKKQSHIVLASNEHQVNQCVVQEEQDRNSKQECQVNVISLCYDKNCQDTQSVHMWPVKPAMKSSHMQSVRPGILQSSYKKHSYAEFKLDQYLCLMTRAVNLPSLCVMTKTVNLSDVNICSQ